MFRAQGELIRANLRFFRLIALQLALLILPFWFLFAQLQANFGQAPLRLGSPAVITVHLDVHIIGELLSPELKAAAEIAIETPAVRNVFRQE